jgi:long-chain acyl-CoA synthetase
VCAYVEPQDGALVAADAVREFLGQHIARYMIPKVIEFHSALPREDTGKIFKRKLRAPYWEAAGRQI